MPVRNLMITAVGAVALASPLLALSPSTAVAASMAAEAAGAYRLSVGDVNVIALSDGLFPLPTDQLLIEDRAGVVKPLLEKAGLPSAPQTAVNAYLIDTGSRRILVDAGSGALLGPSVGHLLEALRAAGYSPDQIDEVLITHLHPDHVGGLANQGRAVFPKATIRVAKAESQFWLDKANQPKVDDSVKGAFDGASASLTPYVSTGRLKPFAPGETLAPGLTAVDTKGHTAGHSAFRLESKGQVMVFWGDIVHVAAVQFPNPAVTIRFDSTPIEARSARLAAYSDAAAKGYRVAASHIDYPGIGKVVRAGDGFAWEPTAAAVRP